jgi:uncharacterized protein (DUF1697 family)
MADLRELLSGLGYGDVRTHLQSGNAMLTRRSGRPEKLAREIENGIKANLGSAFVVWSGAATSCAPFLRATHFRRWQPTARSCSLD